MAYLKPIKSGLILIILTAVFCSGALAAFDQDTALRDLRRGEEEERLEAAKQLGMWGDDNCVQNLELALKDKSWRVQRSAILALGNIGSEDAVQALKKQMRNPDVNVRINTASSLIRCSDPSAYSVITNHVLNDSSWKVRRIGLRGLWGASGELVESALRMMTEDRETRVQSLALATLLERKDMAVVPVLHANLESRDYNERRSAALNLLQIFNDDAGLFVFLEILAEDKDPERRFEVINRLGRIIAMGPERWKDTATRAAMVEALKDESWEVRDAASFILGLIDAPAMKADIDMIINGYSSSSWGIDPASKYVAEYVLNPHKTPAALAANWESLSPNLQEYLADRIAFLPSTGDEALIKALLTSGDHYFMRNGLVGIGKLQESKEPPAWLKNMVPEVIKALENRKPSVKRAAAETLGRLNDPRAVESLIEYVKRRDPYISQTAVQALGVIGASQAADVLGEIVKNEREGINLRLAAADSLGKIEGTAAVDILRGFLQDTDELIRSEAALALAGRGDETIVGTLFVSNDPAVREAVLQGLSGMKAQPDWAVGFFERGVKDKNPKVKLAALQGLSQASDWKPVPGLIAALADSDSDVRIQAARSLRDLRAYSALRPLKQIILTEGADPVVAAEAREAVAQIENLSQ